jgi:hypothetical protein
MAALAYLREDESSTGIIEDDLIGSLLALGRVEAKRLADRLVDVGLFARRDGGYELLHYSTKNETKEQIHARRAATRARVELHRKKTSERSVSERDRNASGNALQAGVTGSGNASQNEFVPGSDSALCGLSSSPEGDRGREPDLGSGVILVGEPTVTLTTKITDECVAIAKGATGGTPIQDVAGAWLKFCGWYAKRSLRLSEAPGRWQSWCVDEAKKERAERERRHERFTSEGLDPNSFEASKIRRRREEMSLAQELQMKLAKTGGRNG